jgi:hypothetical protein
MVGKDSTGRLHVFLPEQDVRIQTLSDSGTPVRDLSQRDTFDGKASDSIGMEGFRQGPDLEGSPFRQQTRAQGLPFNGFSHGIERLGPVLDFHGGRQERTDSMPADRFQQNRGIDGHRRHGELALQGRGQNS